MVDNLGFTALSFASSTDQVPNEVYDPVLMAEAANPILRWIGEVTAQHCIHKTYT